MVGLRDHKLSEKLQLDAGLTLEKALAQARQHEAVKAQQPILRGHKSESVDAVKTKPLRSNKRDKKSVTKTTSQQQLCKRCSRDNHPRDNCPARDAICHKCSVKGHWARVCLSKPKVNEVYFDSDDEDDQDSLVRSSRRTVSTQWRQSRGSPTF